ncbi:MAG: hypothetical protein QOF53_2246 [Nocardioidaceae bacterium]|nr:hypothetical protein [Nocardioidaceae bacterium]
MTAVAVLVGSHEVAGDTWAAVPTLTWWALLPAFVLAEIVVIHVPARRSSHSHTFREFPAIVGLTLLPAPQYLTAYVLGGALALVMWSRLRGVKLAFNVAMFAVEAVLGAEVYHLVLGGTDPLAPRAWAAALAAVVLTDLVSAAAVTAAISFTDGAFDGHVLREALRSGLASTVSNACIALLVVTLLLVRPTALPLLGVVVVLLVLGYRLHVTLSRDYGQMRLLYRFVGSAGRSADLDDVVSAVLSEAALLLKASGARLLVLPSVSTDARAWTWTEDNLATEEPGTDGEGAWWEPTLRGEPVLLKAQDDAVRRGGAAGPRDGVAVPLVDDGEVRGVLMVVDRSFEQETFNATDQQVLATMAAHAAVALDKARAVERLRRVAEEREHEALHDQLTALPNRRSLRDAIETTMASGGRGALLLLDLQDFKDVNDTLGHTAGDELLRVAGRRLQEAVPGMTVARLGADEFAVLLPGLDAVAARPRAERLQDVVSRPVPLGGVEIVISSTVGIADFAGRSCTAEELLAHADVAMSAAKTGRERVQQYRPQDGEATARRLALAADLPDALRSGQLQLWFQPQAATATGQVTGFEALLRWPHPRFGMVPPPELVALAQRTGLMPAVTSFVLRQALADRRQWWLAGHELDVSVNITTGDLTTADLADRVEAALQETGTPPAALVLELTESDALVDPEQSVVVLGGLSALGVRLSIDDFGTGYSSLAYLDRLPVHEVKIDRSFVVRLEQAENPTIVKATVALGHDLGLRVVAEGVESDLTRNRVAELGCDLYQGYGLARPMPGPEVLGWLARRARYTGGDRDQWQVLADGGGFRQEPPATIRA